MTNSIETLAERLVHHAASAICYGIDRPRDDRLTPNMAMPEAHAAVVAVLRVLADERFTHAIDVGPRIVGWLGPHERAVLKRLADDLEGK